MGNELNRVDADKVELAKRAAGQPVNLAIPAGLLVVGAFAGVLGPFFVLALAIYAALIYRSVASNSRSTDAPSRPRRNAPQYAPEIQSEIDKAHATQKAIDKSIAAADHPFEEIQEDVRMIVSAMETSAKRAQLIHDTLHDQTQSGHDERAIVAQIEKLRPRFNDKDVRELVNDLEAQRASHVQLRESLERFKINMARLNASLGLMRTRLVEMSAAEEATVHRELTAQARDIRDRTERYTRVLLETSEPASDDDLQRELDQDAARKGGPTVIPMRNRAQPPPAPAPTRKPAPVDTGPRQVPLRNRSQPPAPPKPAPVDEGPREIPLRNVAKPAAKADDDGPRKIDMRNRSRDQRKK